MMHDDGVKNGVGWRVLSELVHTIHARSKFQSCILLKRPTQRKEVDLPWDSRSGMEFWK